MDNLSVWLFKNGGRLAKLAMAKERSLLFFRDGVGGENEIIWLCNHGFLFRGVDMGVGLSIND